MGTSSGTADAVLLGHVASALASEREDALPRALAVLVDGAGLRSAVLRDPTGAPLAVAGDVVHAVPVDRGGRPPEPVVELPVAARSRHATLTVVGARAAQLPLLRAVAAVLALAHEPAGDLAGDPALPLALLTAADDDADDTADALHDGPVQELVFARLAADAAVRGGDVVVVREAVQGALQSLRRALWFLRPRAADGELAGALAELSSRLVEAGRPPLELDLDDDACDGLSGPAAALAYRLVQALAAPADGHPTTVTATRDGACAVLRVGSAGPVPHPDRWAARARAVGGSTSCPDGAVVLQLPLSLPLPAPSPTPLT